MMKAKNLTITLILTGIFLSAACVVFACPGQLPIAILSAIPQYILPGQTVTLDGSASYHPDLEPESGIRSYYWDFTNDGGGAGGYDYHEFDYYHPDGAFDGKTTYTYNDLGTYTAKLRVYDIYDDIAYDTCTVYVKKVKNITTGIGYDTIQAAITAANSGNVIVVSEGTYNETIDFSGKACTLRSTDPDDPDVVAATIIDADDTNADVVTFENSEGSSTILSGFTITGGGCGIFCDDADPTITKCVITGNEASGSGGGMYNYYADPSISNCTFSNNGAAYGGGMFNYSSSPTITTCLFYDNETIVSSGGNGAAIYCYNYSDATIENCTISQNVSDNFAGGIIADSYSDPVIKNSIVWGNDDAYGPADIDAYNSSAVTVTYSDYGVKFAYGATIDTSNNCITTDPLFADAGNNDFHLKSAVGRWNGSTWVTTDTTTSWCVDAGDPSSAYSNEPSPNGGRINMGAYGNTVYASKSDDRMIIYVDSSNTTSPWLGTEDDPYKTIQAGINNVRSKGIVFVLDGTYHELLYFNSGHKEFSLIGVDYPIIDGEYDGRVITFDHTTNTIVIDGFCIARGYDIAIGGGIYIDNSSPTIMNCTVIFNWAGYFDPEGYVNGAWGGGLYIVDGNPAITHCTFYANTVDGVDHDPDNWPNQVINYFTLNKGGAIYTDNSSATFSYCTIGDTDEDYYNLATGHAYYPWASHEVYTKGSTVPTYDHCGVLGGFNGDRMHHDSTAPIDGGGNSGL